MNMNIHEAVACFFEAAFGKEHLPEIGRNAAAFLLALGIHGIIRRYNEKSTFRSMLMALRFEATANEAVITSWDTLPVVFKEFKINTAQALLGNPLFMKYIERNSVKLINEYATILSLQNSYRRVKEALEFHPGKKAGIISLRGPYGANAASKANLKEVKCLVGPCDRVKEIEQRSTRSLWPF